MKRPDEDGHAALAVAAQIGRRVSAVEQRGQQAAALQPPRQRPPEGLAAQQQRGQARGSRAAAASDVMTWQPGTCHLIRRRACSSSARPQASWPARSSWLAACCDASGLLMQVKGGMQGRSRRGAQRRQSSLRRQANKLGAGKTCICLCDRSTWPPLTCTATDLDPAGGRGWSACSSARTTTPTRARKAASGTSQMPCCHSIPLATLGSAAC
jgi:hypothetical protein